jgi:hypothetical protein
MQIMFLLVPGSRLQMKLLNDGSRRTVPRSCGLEFVNMQGGFIGWVFSHDFHLWTTNSWKIMAQTGINNELVQSFYEMSAWLSSRI